MSFVTVRAKALPCKERQKVGCKPIFNSGGSPISAKKGHWESFSPLNPSTSGLLSPKDRLENLRKSRPFPPSLHLGTKGLKRMRPLSQRAAPGGKERKDLETAPLARALCLERMETPGGRGPQAGSGNPTAVASGRRKNGPQAWPARMRNATPSQGPGRDVNPEPPQGPRPRARACAPGHGSGGLALSPAPAAAAHGAGRRVRPPPGLRPQDPPAPAAYTQAYLRAASSRLRAARTARLGPRTADTWRLPLKRPGSAG